LADESAEAADGSTVVNVKAIATRNTKTTGTSILRIIHRHVKRINNYMHSQSLRQWIVQSCAGKILLRR